MSQSPYEQALAELRAQVSKMLEKMDQKSPLAAAVVFKVKKDKESNFKRDSADLSLATLNMPGVKLFEYHKHKSIQPDPVPLDYVQYLIYEEWDTVSFFRVQWDSDHLKRFQAAVGDLVVAQPELNFYHGTPDARHAYVGQTGQKRCWDSNGNLIPCKNTGEDGEIQAGVADPVPRFTDNQDGTVTDNLTGLIWLRNANLFGEVPWAQALINAKNLASGSSGLTDGSAAGDWRLPNVNEFQSLLDLKNSSGPAIDPEHPFINLQASNYWTSTSVAVAPPLGWFVALAVGPPVFDLKMNSMRMWPVRGENTRLAQTGQKVCFDTFGAPVACAGTGQDADIQAGVPFPTPRFSDNKNGTETDRLTGLIWLKHADAFGTRTWNQALSVCNTLASGKADLSDGSIAGDWRLPNAFELRTLMDYSTFNPALTPGNPFLSVSTSLYWSSTTVASAPNLARFVFVGIGPSVWDHKSVLMHVWPVRGGRRSK